MCIMAAKAVATARLAALRERLRAARASDPADAVPHRRQQRQHRPQPVQGESVSSPPPAATARNEPTAAELAPLLLAAAARVHTRDAVAPPPIRVRGPLALSTSLSLSVVVLTGDAYTGRPCTAGAGGGGG
jgi:hypothetical protein